MDNTQAVTGTVVAPTAPQTITDKLTAMAVADQKRPKVILKLEDGGDNVGFYIDTRTLIENIGPSKAGTSNGVVLAVNGDFAYEQDGKRYTFNLALQGGWAGIKVTSITDVVPALPIPVVKAAPKAEAAKATA